MLKKQTVWLLTMLSLMIVLSVYYISSDPNDFAYSDLGENDDATEETANGMAEEADANITPGGNELFASLRLQVLDKRSSKRERLEGIVASSTATPEDKKEALDEMDAIDATSTKEFVLEESILAEAEYQDVLVRSDGDTIHVYVEADELTKTEIVNIMQMVRDEFGEITVDVIHEPTSES